MTAGIYISSLWSSKSRQWISGRLGWTKKLKALPVKEHTRIWFHTASLGEFEQARPVIEQLKEQQPDIEIILTFFSPSGYSMRKDYPLASVFYLPADLPGHAKKWLRLVQPDMAVFVKYDLWAGFLKNVLSKQIPAYLISANWIPGSIFQSWSFPPVNALLKKFNAIFFQNGNYVAYFKSKGFENIHVAGDTRIDRSLALPKESIHKIPDVLKDAGPFDLVAGSTWSTDETLLQEVITTLQLKVLLVPHEVTETTLQRITKLFANISVRLSDIEAGNPVPSVILVDQVGILSALYSLGRIAYVGGGFGAGIHNTLEPMAHQKPVIFGPKFQKFPEAVEVVKAEGAWTISNASELRSLLEELLRPGIAETAGKKGYAFLTQNQGATDKVTGYILDSIPFPIKE